MVVPAGMGLVAGEACRVLRVGRGLAVDEQPEVAALSGSKAGRHIWAAPPSTKSSEPVTKLE